MVVRGEDSIREGSEVGAVMFKAEHGKGTRGKRRLKRWEGTGTWQPSR